MIWISVGCYYYFFYNNFEHFCINHFCRSVPPPQVENTIRWRVKRDEEGNEIKESNARIVKWSDGR